jgi:hypothetical protein
LGVLACKRYFHFSSSTASNMWELLRHKTIKHNHS